MSLLNVVVGDARVLLAVDTAIRFPSSRTFDELGESVPVAEHASKMTLLVGTGAVLAVLGSLAMLHDLAYELVPLEGSFDRMRDALPGTAERVSAHRQARADRLGVNPYVFESAHIVLAGESSQGLGAWAVTLEGGKASAPFSLAPWTAHPSLPGELYSRAPQTHEQVLAIARDQVKWARAFRPSIAAGGRLVIAEMTPWRTTITTHDLATPVAVDHLPLHAAEPQRAATAVHP